MAQKINKLLLRQTEVALFMIRAIGIWFLSMLLPFDLPAWVSLGAAIFGSLAWLAIDKIMIKRQKRKAARNSNFMSKSQKSAALLFLGVLGLMVVAAKLLTLFGIDDSYAVIIYVPGVVIAVLLAYNELRLHRR